MALMAAACMTAGRPSFDGTGATRAVIERYLAAANAGDADAAAGLFADDAIYRDKTFDFEIRGASKVRGMLEGAFRMLRPVTRTVNMQVYEGPQAAIEWQASGTHSGSVMGMPATNRPMTIRGVSLITVRNGKIVSVTDYMDRAGLEAQLKQ